MAEKRKTLGEASRSIFEDVAENKQNELQDMLNEWDRRWGHHDTDHVNVVKYPKSYADKLHIEAQCWKAGLNAIYENGKARALKNEFIEVVSECKLIAEEQAELEDIDAQIQNLNYAHEQMAMYPVAFAQYKKMKIEDTKEEALVVEEFSLR